MSQRQPDFGSQHRSRRTDQVPADWSSSSLALPVDSLADEPLGRDAGPHSPFAAMLLSPQPFRVEVSGRDVAQPVRRCMTHLLPVRPTSVGRTNLTSQGAPRSVPFGEPDDRERILPTHQLTRDAESDKLPASAVSTPFAATFAPSGVNLGLTPAPTRAAQHGPKSVRFPYTVSPERPKTLRLLPRPGDAEFTSRQKARTLLLAGNGRFCQVFQTPAAASAPQD